MIHLASPLAQYRAHAVDIRTAVARVLEGGAYILGPEVEAFERVFAVACGVDHAVGVGNGTDALIIALRALGVGPGDEVVTVSHTAVATAAAVIAVGATPVLVDIDSVHYTIDPAKIGAAVSPRSKAIIAVHLYGQPADMDVVMATARRHGLKVVEDCAQSIGASYKSRALGSIGDAGTFSFYPTKNLGAIGDGGAVVTGDAAVAARMTRLRQYGWDEARRTDEVGLNTRLDPLQAAILGAKLPYLAADNARRGAIAARYAAGLAGLPLALPAARAYSSHAYHLYVVACDDREALIRHLAGAGIASGIHYPVPVHLHRGYAERVRLPEGGLPVTERVVGRIISLPMYPELGDAEVDAVIAAARAFYEP
jgi:dTDP-4-amino-4,6-dideoxygalactose transaminase